MPPAVDIMTRYTVGDPASIRCDGGLPMPCVYIVIYGVNRGPQCYGESDRTRIENAEYPGRRDAVIAEKRVSVSVSMLLILCIGLAYSRMHLWTR